MHICIYSHVNINIKQNSSWSRTFCNLWRQARHSARKCKENKEPFLVFLYKIIFIATNRRPYGNDKHVPTLCTMVEAIAVGAREVSDTDVTL